MPKINIASASCNVPIRIPCVGWGCEGGFDADLGCRPFKHASRARDNWRRSIRKAQRRAWKRVEE